MQKRRGRSTRMATRKAARRPVNYAQLTHPFAPQTIYSDDQVAALHGKALDVLEQLGIAIGHAEARQILTRSGAVADDQNVVKIGRDVVAEALSTAPSSVRIHALNPERAQDYAHGKLILAPAGGCPNVSDRLRGRRPGSLETMTEATKLVQSFDALHKMPVAPEPQDVPVHLRHIAMLKAQLTHGDKMLSVYARGRGQTEQIIEMLCESLGLSADDLKSQAWLTTIINSNSPRLLDAPMAEGIIDFARAGQLSVITPFCLAGAMAPASVEGALILQHAEALAGITLAQMTRPGAPVSYGGFSSNVDMKSGAPAFGTPEHVRLQIGSGQLARHIGLPWRSAAGSAANLADAQGAQENLMALWGAMQAGATLVLHAAGWLEGGLTFGFEKFITDMDQVQALAELCQVHQIDDLDAAFGAIAEVQPGGHFFATQHTLDRFEDAFYAPLNADLSNFGNWEAGGGLNAETRATIIWQQVLEDYTQPAHCAAIADRVHDAADRLERQGGAEMVGL